MSGAVLAVACPAKVNLGLRVVGRRPDGYHELDTVFQAIGLEDQLEAGPAGEFGLACDAPGVPLDETNLVLRAARLLAEWSGKRGLGASFVLRKTIPAGGGLGGGSSNAAGALLLCERLWCLGLGPGALAPLAARLGADVPFFLLGGTARGRGRGDLLEPLTFAGARPVVLGCPPFGIATSEVYRELGARLTGAGIGVSLPLPSAHKWPAGKDFGSLVNDLERVVFPKWPELERFRDALGEGGARIALLSGSGSTVFGVFEGVSAAASVAERLKARFPGWRVLSTQFVEAGVRFVRPQGGEASAGLEA